MSYQRKSVQILGGGFNLLPPGDKVPQTDYLLAQNFRVDRVGKLLSRFGYQQSFSIPGAGLAHSAATMGGAKSPYYVGCNSAIANPSSAVYYNGNPTPIATGFDGNRIGFASQNGAMWIMNRGKQGSHSAAGGFGPFTLTAPPASVTAAAGSGPVPAVSADYTYGSYGTTTDDFISGGNTSQTITPASMTLASGQQMIVGLGLIISDPVLNKAEVVTVTAISATTFTAVFRDSYAGPGTCIGEYGYVHSITIAGTTYSFADIGYSNAGETGVPSVIAGLAGLDPNATTTYPGSGNIVTIAPVQANVLVPISGSDGNAPANLAVGPVTVLPNGIYQYYITFVSADLSLESNPSPASNPVTVASQPIVITIPAADYPTDPRVGFVNIYRSGGTQGNAYRVGQVHSTVGSPATTYTDSMPDLQATNGGQVMPGADADHPANDPPPAAAGIIGPYFGRLIAWSSAAHVNRVWYTNPGVPQYWPGSANDQEGNWFDVGDEGEGVVWCTLHSNELVIYKEKSVWILIGPPVGGTLQQYRDGMGLAGQFALVSAGLVDYFVGPGGLHKFDMNNVIDVDMNVSPLFTTSMSNSPGLTPPGSVLPGSAWNSNLSTAYAVALGYGMGKLYVSYAEQATPARHSILLALHEDSGRWFYHRNADPGTDFYGFFFDGSAMIGLTGSPGTQALGMNVDDFRAFSPTDPAGTPLECVYKSHYENCGLPDNQKMWLEVVVDCELLSTSGSVWASFDNGAMLAEIGIVTGAGQRQSLAFPLNALSGISANGGVLARNIAIALDLTTSGQVVIHNVYLYYYVEARLADSIATIPVDLGVGQVKQCKELELDINTVNGAVTTIVASDLPGNVIATRETITVPSTGGRGVLKFPFAFQEGFLWQLALTGNQFRLYAARLLMRIVGVYVEAYEATAGFVWDSMEMNFDSGVTHIPRGYSMALASWPVKQAREISLEIDTVNQPVTVTLLTDLPGNVQAVRFTATVAANGRRFVRVPLPQGTSAPIEGRIYRLQSRPDGCARSSMSKGSSDVLEEVVVTRHGPIVERIEDPERSIWRGLALQWTALQPGGAAEGLLRLQRATDWKSFRDAFVPFDAPSQNVVYADVDGHIGYLLSGRVPVRKRKPSGLPVQGWTGDAVWTATSRPRRCRACSTRPSSRSSPPTTGSSATISRTTSAPTTCPGTGRCASVSCCPSASSISRIWRVRRWTSCVPRHDRSSVC